MALQTPVMGRSKKPKDPAQPSGGSEKYRKDHKMVRIRIRLAEAAEAAALLLEHDLTQYINDAVRERLERAGQWPPKPASPPPAG